MNEQGRSNSLFRFGLAKAIAVLALTIAPFLSASDCNGQSNLARPLEQLAGSERQLAKDQLRLRLTWGGGAAQTWTGNVKVSGGAFSDVSPLGLAPDSPASVSLVDGELLIRHWTAADYGGVDVTLDGTAETQIHLTLTSSENPDVHYEKQILLEELISHSVTGEIDALGNRCTVVRVPGDQLMVSFERDHLVFRPGELFQFRVQPNLTGISSRSATARIKVAAAKSRGFAAVRFASAATVSFQLSDRGSANAEPVEVSVPQREGVYNIELELEPVWYQASFTTRKNVIRRRIQVMVLDDQPIDDEQVEPWRQVSMADPVAPVQEGVSAWNRFQGRLRESLGNELHSPIESNGQMMMRIAPGGWQAIPLEFAAIGKPHRVEIEYVTGESVAIGFSVLELDAKGQVSLEGCDSGLFLPEAFVGEARKKGIDRHRITIWPSTKTPYLLIANRHPNQPAIIGKIRVFAGPDRLADNGPTGDSTRPTRKMMAFYESPRFFENFGSVALPDSNPESLDDWTKFYQGADRLIQYLKANSYRGAFLTVASDGSSIYPSPLLSPSPKFDNGTFFRLGQDPVRKDVLEMLFRMFEREGLVLVPSIAMTSPIPEVESIKKRRVESGIELVDLNQNRNGPSFGGVLPIYNPLDRQVQLAVQRIVEELARRYQGHDAFQGIAIICRPDTYTLLPGRQWGNDVATVRQFFQQLPHSESIPTQWAQVHRVLLGSHRERWIQWRANQMSSWYRNLADTMRRAIPQGTLYLAPVDLYRNEEISSALSPSLHGTSNYEQQMLEMGFSTELISGTDHRSLSEQSLGPGDLGNQPSLVVLRPHRLAPDQPFASERVDWSVENSKRAQQFFAHSGYAGDLFTHRISWAHFAQLQTQGPFKQQSSPLMRLQQMTPAAPFNRRRFVQSIKNRDARMLVDGGAMIAMGQEDSVADLMSVFGQLPDIPFTDVVSGHDANISTLPLAVRQIKFEGESFFYAANASPWPIQLNLQLSAPQVSGISIESFSGARFERSIKDESLGNPENEESTNVQWVVQVPPFGLVGGRLSGPDVTISDYQFEFPDNAGKELRKRVYALQSKLNKSKNAKSLGVIENPGFEREGKPTMSHWDVGEPVPGSVRLDSDAHPDQAAVDLGNVSMVMTSDGTRPVWIRSNSFDAPQTGRLSISVWLKTDDPANQPPLRLAIEGHSNGANYYRFGSVGSLSPDPESNQLESRWKRFAVHFDDLPVTGLTHVRIGFDLMGPGKVLIDRVQVFDRWFDENDARAITQLLASTGPLLSREETLDSCRRLLEGYWACFLDEYFPTEDPTQIEANRLNTPRPNSNPDQDVTDPPPTGQPTQTGSEPSSSRRKSPMFRRFRNLVPQRQASGR